MTSGAAAPFSARTAWARSLATPLREFLRTETGGAAVLLAAAVAALVWANVDASSYDALWETTLSIRSATAGVALDLRDWVNSGLMTFFFFVVGLEARREFDLGELRERRRFALPLRRRRSAGWPCRSRSTCVQRGQPVGARLGRRDVDRHGVRARHARARRPALPRPPARLPAHGGRRRRPRRPRRDRDSSTPDDVGRPRCSWRSALFAASCSSLRLRGVRIGLVYALLGVAVWVALLESGVDPVVVGLVMGLLAYAYPAARARRSSARRERFREFREQPTPELARSARARACGRRSRPNERLQQLFHPWTSYVDRAALRARERRHRDRRRLPAGARSRRRSRSASCSATCVGKPVGIFGATWLATRLSRGRLQPPVGWAAVAGGGTIAGHRLHGLAADRDARVRRRASSRRRSSASSARRSARRRSPGSSSARPRCCRARAAHPGAARHRRADRRPRRRRRPGARPHPRARSTRPSRWSSTATSSARTAAGRAGRPRAARRLRRRPLRLAAPAAHRRPPARAARGRGGRGGGRRRARSGRCTTSCSRTRMPWSSTTSSATRSSSASTSSVRRRATRPRAAARVAEDVDSADLSGVSGTPTFFVNGRRHHGAYDIATLSAAVRAAGARVLVAERRIDRADG